MKKKVTKEDVRKWFEEHKKEIILTGIGIGSIIFACRKSYYSGYTAGVEASEITKFAIGDVPDAVKNNQIPMIFHTKGNGMVFNTFSDLDRFQQNLNDFIKEYKND